MTNLYADRYNPKLLAELKEVKQMGYLAMICENSVGGFESWSDFEDAAKRKEYYESCVNQYK